MSDSAAEVDVLRSRAEAAEAELAKVQPLVQRAYAWYDCPFAEQRIQAEHDLVTAIRAYRAGKACPPRTRLVDSGQVIPESGTWPNFDEIDAPTDAT